MTTSEVSLAQHPPGEIIDLSVELVKNLSASPGCSSVASIDRACGSDFRPFRVTRLTARGLSPRMSLTFNDHASGRCGNAELPSFGFSFPDGSGGGNQVSADLIFRSLVAGSYPRSCIPV